MWWHKDKSGLARLAVLACASAAGQCEVATTTQTLSAQIAPVAKLSLPASVLLASAGTTFLQFTGTLVVSYRARTTPAGNGNITLQVTTDFTPSGGPSAAVGSLRYTCAGASLGSPCTGTQSASTSSQTPVLGLPASACTGGGGACSSADPNTVQVGFTLENDPSFHTGTYSAQLTLVISAI
jgi:hypothetical protein